MSEEIPELPKRMPPPPHPKLAGPRPPRPATTKIPRVFNIWGTIVYGGCAAFAMAFMIMMGFGIIPPWYIILPCLLYVFVSSGNIAFGRIEANKDARFFTQALRKRGEENKQRQMRKMN
jgi:hypothetical protein